MVSHLGDHPQHPRGTHLLCRPELLRRLVEQRYVIRGGPDQPTALGR